MNYKKLFFLLWILTYQVGYCQETILFTSDTFPEAKFGVTVAATDEVLIVGAWDGNPDVSLGGAVYVFRKEGADWIEEAKLLPSDPNYQQEFSLESIAIHGDYILVGAHNGLGTGVDPKGSAYVFKREGNQWNEQAKLTPSDGGVDQDRFGKSVYLFQDYAIIGATGMPVGGNNGSGAAYIFKRDGSDWVEQKKLIPSDPTPYAYFGGTVSMNENFVFVGAPRAENDGIKSGAVYIFEKDGLDWVEETKLYTSENPTANTGFGYRIAVQNEKALIGVRRGETYNGYDRGIAYIYTYDGEDWTEENKLAPIDIEEEDKRGRDVALFGNRALICLNGEHNTGRMYLFEKEGNVWQQKSNIVPSDVTEYDQFGRDIALSENYAFTGAFSNSSSGLSGAGAAYVYELDLLPTNIEAPALKSLIHVFPNPTSNLIRVELETGSSSTATALKVYDIQGRLISSYSKSSDNLWEVNTMSYPSGTYILQVEGVHQVYTSRFVKF